MPSERRTATGRAHARAGLLGNPSDGYAGKAIALSVCNFSAEVRIRRGDRFAIVPEAGALGAPTVSAFVDDLRERGCYDGTRLVRAALKKFADEWSGLAGIPRRDPKLRFELSYETDIPRQVGLAGSSAIVIAALRALTSWFQVDMAPDRIAELALAAELEELGIAAGPMDRVIQAYEGVMLMDLAPPRTAESYRRLDPALLPPLFVAWDPEIGDVSGDVHADVRRRWLLGDPEILELMKEFRSLVDRGVACLEEADHAGFRACVDRNLEMRSSVFSLGRRDLEMIAIGRALGAAVKLCGSGGAVIGVMRDEGEFDDIERGYADAGLHAIRPALTAGTR